MTVPLLGGVRPGLIVDADMESILPFFRMHWDHEPAVE